MTRPAGGMYRKDMENMKKIDLSVLDSGCDFVRYIRAFEGLGWDINYYENKYNLQDGRPYTEWAIRVYGIHNMGAFHFYSDGRFNYFHSS